MAQLISAQKFCPVAALNKVTQLVSDYVVCEPDGQLKKLSIDKDLARTRKGF
jgi:hypothetical protein